MYISIYMFHDTNSYDVSLEFEISPYTLYVEFTLLNEKILSS